FGESSSVSLGYPTSIAHFDHQEKGPGRIIIVSSDLRSRKTPFKKRLRRLDDLHLDSSHRLNATDHRQLKAKKISNPSWVLLLDHQEEDPGRILIVSCDLRRLLREFTLNHASQDFGDWMIFFWIQTIDLARRANDS
ncbi:hypothetical protein PRIPAC_89343, partial [Pristionchus pacificus]|uniref:Uncharacterized protein n=1 Tax=Pristionchus pacificus TaxID=54126 RepID=A0A2A6CTS0_PRIPA